MSSENAAPPIGVMPQWRWRELRCQELEEAWDRYGAWLKENAENLTEKRKKEIDTLITGWAVEFMIHKRWLHRKKAK